MRRQAEKGLISTAVRCQGRRGKRPGRIAHLARALLLGLIVVFVSGCGGNHRSTRSTTRPATTSLQSLVDVRHVVYPSGRTAVSALVAVPRAGSERGCLIWQFGLGSRKEDAAEVWQGVARLGLTTFSIDVHLHGIPLSPAQQGQVAQDPSAFKAMIRETATDLRYAVAYLHRQPYCRGRVAYAGVSLGGAVGVEVAATDAGVDAAVLMSTPATVASVVPSGVILSHLEHHPRLLRRALKILAPVDPDRFVGRIAPRPVMILSGTRDPIVPRRSAREFQAAARSAKVIVNYDGDHDPFAGVDGPENGNKIASFLLRYVVEPTYGINDAARNGTYTIP
jgi:fermentation-respiration switch protein FrsA (DUF1100 family)